MQAKLWRSAGLSFGVLFLLMRYLRIRLHGWGVPIAEALSVSFLVSSVLVFVVWNPVWIGRKSWTVILLVVAVAFYAVLRYLHL